MPTKIVVPVKQVAALDEDFELEEGDAAVDADFLDWSLNEWDRYSLEAALQLTEADGGEVVALSVGDEQAEEGLLACLAAGAGRAVRIWDEALEGADALAVARVLADAVRREEPDLVLCGVQSSDMVNSATGVALAAHLGLRHVAVVRGLQLDAAARQLVVERELEGGLSETLALALPALLTVQTGINEPRYATLRAIKQAREKPLDVVDLDVLGLSAEQVGASSGARVRRLAPPPVGDSAELLNGSSEDVAARIAALVKERVA
ncbi:MAG TPA: electron transfer flavoprotein subunit beta/FixA family protein [Conexibacter sp.]